jgi:hypothetical protein
LNFPKFKYSFNSKMIQTHFANDEEQGEHATFIDEDIPLDPLLGGRKQPNSRRESTNNRGRTRTSLGSITRFLKSPIFLLMSLVISLIVIITLALQSAGRPSKPILAKALEIIKDSRPRYSFDSSESYKLSAGTGYGKEWTSAGPDGSYVERNGNEIVMRHLETAGETILVASGDIKDVRLR